MAREHEDIRAVLRAIGLAEQRHTETIHPHAHHLCKAHGKWWKQRNVVGMCISRKLAGGTLDEALSLQILVRKKRPKSKLGHRCIPKRIRAGRIGVEDDIVTDVIQVGEPRLEALTSEVRPAKPGYNIGHKSGGTGTLGCVVRDKASQALAALSCAHVIADSGQAAIDDMVMVPSRGVASDNDVVVEARFGRLTRIGPLRTGREHANTNVDAATAAPLAAGDVAEELAILGLAPTGVRNDPPIDLSVFKVGYKSLMTWGRVMATDVLISFRYPQPNGSTASVWFSDQIGITRFTSDGDSGALVLDEQYQAVGLHFGVTDTMSVCTPMSRVLSTLDSELP